MEKQDERIKMPLLSKEEYEQEMGEQRRAIEVLKSYDDFSLWEEYLNVKELTYKEYLEEYKKYFSIDSIEQ